MDHPIGVRPWPLTRPTWMRCGSSVLMSTADHTPAAAKLATVIVDLTPVLDGIGRASCSAWYRDAQWQPSRTG